MDFREAQLEFDNVKWFDSIIAGEDRCGSYDFCEDCDKEEEDPCARAMDRHENKGNVIVHLQKVPQVQGEVCIGDACQSAEDFGVLEQPKGSMMRALRKERKMVRGEKKYIRIATVYVRRALKE